jgi:hypothetical protein
MKRRIGLLATRIIVIGLGISLLSCGSNKNSSESELASRLDPGEVMTTTKPVALCNGASSPNYTVYQKAYLDSSPQWNPVYVFAKLKQFPASFATASRYIEFFRWKADSTGPAFLDPSPLQFQVIDLNTNLPISQTWRKSLSWVDLSEAIQATGLSTPATLFARIAFKIDLDDPAGDYDVLRTQVYPFGSKTPEEFSDGLIPIFHASPVDYAFEPSGTTRARVLQNLHPLRNTTLSAEEQTSRMNSFCEIFKI